MAASRRHSCRSLVGSEPLHSCCITSSFYMGKGMKLDVTSKPNQFNPARACLQLSGTGGTRRLYLKIEFPRPVMRITESQGILAAALFFGSLMSHSIHYETPGGTENEAEEGPSRWDAERRSSCSSDSSWFNIAIYTDYSLIRIREDGESLFRSIVYGYSSERKTTMPHGDEMSKLASKLRKLTVQELDKRRTMVERFIEGDFEEYVQRMAREETLAGEVEMSTLSHVIMMPIRVVRHDEDLGGLVIIEEYGSMYRSVDPINILYKDVSG